MLIPTNKKTATGKYLHIKDLNGLEPRYCHFTFGFGGGGRRGIYYCFHPWLQEERRGAYIIGFVPNYYFCGRPSSVEWTCGKEIGNASTITTQQHDKWLSAQYKIVLKIVISYNSHSFNKCVMINRNLCILIYSPLQFKGYVGITLSAVCLSVCLSVRPSVRPSVQISSCRNSS